MFANNMNDIKRALYNLCMAYAEARIAASTEAIQSAQQSAGEETKSSAGDKYETGREMMQQETNRNMAQLTEANKLKIALSQIAADGLPLASVQPGSLAITNNGKFYIAISAGALLYNSETYFAVSMASPIGRQFQGKKSGDNFTLNNKVYIIQSIL
jgi:transcription elongation GreA/GreB family factor